ncbi:MAG TPA: heterodisulfide reductase subunit B [Firmicutes bacterium]|jgi:heterodisulfide reductase subunit B|nr:heterodisulfide reductase subunit B [Bacillota bacterium]
MRYAYYPGCSLESTGIEYYLSSLAVARKLGVELWEIPEWNCCGASFAHSSSYLLSLALPARNLVLAEKEGLDVVVSCAACYSRLKNAVYEARKSVEVKEKIGQAIGQEYRAQAEVYSMIEVFTNHLGLEKVAQAVVRPLEGLRVASYYGCLLVRPPELAMDDAENPRSLERITMAIGGAPVEWNFKVECCGAFHSTFRPDVGFQMIDRILEDALREGADCIALACPMCMMNLDMRQKDINKMKKSNSYIPVLYFTELMGLALGLAPKELGVNRHFVNAMPLLKKKVLQQ